MIRDYEQRFSCRLIVINDYIFAYSVTLLEELIHDCSADLDLHVMLNSPGGDGETAVRMVRSAQSRCRELTVIVPDQAKSAGTLFTLGAHHIIMGPSSDLGPVDPQLQIGKPGQQQLVAAKDIIAAVESATTEVSRNAESYPIFAAMMSDINVIILQQAKSALRRTDDLLSEAISANPNRSAKQVETLTAAVKAALVDSPHMHAAGFGAKAARENGLPILDADTKGDQWTLIWRLWTRFFHSSMRIYEGNRASQTIGSWVAI